MTATTSWSTRFARAVERYVGGEGRPTTDETPLPGAQDTNGSPPTGGAATGPQAQRTVLDNATVLIVDDDPALLASLTAALHSSCIVHTAQSASEALVLAEELDDLAVVIADLHMPDLDGTSLLQHIRELTPEAVRILLTGHIEAEAVIAAINRTAVYRILLKPCSLPELEGCLQDAIAQHRLLVAERELLTRTLRGSVRALLETLSLANPLAFSRAERIRNRVLTLMDALEIERSWDIEVAAMLSQLGTVTLPPTLNESLHEGRRVTPHLQALIDRLPSLSADLLVDIPRLEEVRDSILYQDQRFDGRGLVSARMKGHQIPLGSRLLRVATDYDMLEARGTTVRQAIAELRSQRGLYDPDVLDALEHVVTMDEETQAPIDQIRLEDLRSGMVLAADIVAEGDVMLCGRGQEVTQRTIDRVSNWAKQYRIIQPIEVFYGPSSQE